MLELYVKAQMIWNEAMDLLNDKNQIARRHDERGMSETASNALLVVAAIGIVAILVVAITTFITNKAAIIAGS